MATASTSLQLISPADQRTAIRTTSESRIKALRLTQERARMAFVSAMKTLRQTPKESPERAFRSTQFKQAKHSFEAAKSAVIHAQTVLNITLDSINQSEAELIGKATEALAIETQAWAKECKTAQAPFEFVVNRKGGRLRPAKGTVRAACRLVCMNEQSKIDHEAGCPECQKRLAPLEI